MELRNPERKVPETACCCLQALLLDCSCSCSKDPHDRLANLGRPCLHLANKGQTAEFVLFLFHLTTLTFEQSATAAENLFCEILCKKAQPAHHEANSVALKETQTFSAFMHKITGAVSVVNG